MLAYRHVFQRLLHWHNRKRLYILFGNVRRVEAMVLVAVDRGFPFFDFFMFVLFIAAFLPVDLQREFFFDLSLGGFLRSGVVVFAWAVLGSLGLSGSAKREYIRLLERHCREVDKKEGFLERYREEFVRDATADLDVHGTPELDSAIRNRIEYFSEKLASSLSKVQQLRIFPKDFSLNRCFIEAQRLEVFGEIDELTMAVDEFRSWISMFRRVQLEIRNIAVVLRLNREFPCGISPCFEEDAMGILLWFDELVKKVSRSSIDWEARLGISCEYNQESVTVLCKRLIGAWADSVAASIADESAERDRRALAESIQTGLLNQPGLVLSLMLWAKQVGAGNGRDHVM